MKWRTLVADSVLAAIEMEISTVVGAVRAGYNVDAKGDEYIEAASK